MTKIKYFNEVREQTSDVITELLAIDMEYITICCEDCAEDLIDDIKDTYGDEITDEDYTFLLGVAFQMIEDDIDE